MPEDTLIYFGDAVKVLDDNGRIGALGIRFSDGRKKDLSGEFFTSKTYLGPHDGDGQECTFDHGFPLKADLEEYSDHTFAPVKARREKLGIWVETALNLADDYEKAVFNLAKKGKLGWSSGSAGHRVKKDEKTGEIKSWPVAEWALTPRPCEPQNYGTALPLKSLGGIKFVDLDSETETETPLPKPAPMKPAAKFGERIGQLITDREEDGQERAAVIKSLASAAMLRPDQVELIITENQRPSNAVIKAFARVLRVDYDLLKDLADKGTPKTIKGLFEEELAERTPSTWELESAMRCVIKKIAEAATASAEAGGEYEWQPKVTETMKEYTVRMTDLVNTQVASWVAGEWDGDEFYLKTAIVTNGALVTGGLDFNEHSELVVTAFEEITKRFRDNHEMRVKAGRVLSEKNRSRLSKLVDQMMTAVTECQNLLEETKPMANDMEKNAAWINHQRVKHQIQRAQIGV